MNDSKSRHSVILTTDCGTEVDDQWALAHLALSRELDLLGVVTTHAPNLPPPPSESSAAAVRDVLAHLALDSVPPVFAGSGVPLSKKGSPNPNAGVDFILEQSRRFTDENKLKILAIGAATDVASAFLLDPTLPERADVVAMGFQGWEEGGDEWNVNNDVAAWQVILESGADVTIGGAKVCIRDLKMSLAKACEIFDGCDQRSAYLTGMLEAFFKASSGVAQHVTGSPETWPMWDSITVAYLLGFAETRLMPRPVLMDDKSFVITENDDSVVRWVTGVDAAGLWRDFAGKLI